MVHRAVILLCCLVTTASSADDVPAPLAIQGEMLSQVNHALIRLSQGDTAPLEALPLAAFLTPVARADSRTPDVWRRWTADLPAALARLDGTRKAQALIRLDGLYRAARDPGLSEDERARIAAAFLPAPAATALLTTTTDRAFDRGRFEDFLALAEMLSHAGAPPIHSARRQEVATLLSGRGPEVDAALRLPAPGLPHSTAAAADAINPALAVRWAISPGWLLACDPWNRALWQHRIDRTAIVHPGAGYALVNDSHGLRALSDNGTLTILAPLPAEARILSVAGGAAWFATGSRVWRLTLADNLLLSFELSEPPLAAPLVRGAQSLWLTTHELLLYQGDQLASHIRHGLPADRQWRLGSERQEVLITAGDGRNWRLEALTEQLPQLSRVDQALLLIRAGRAAEALTLIDGDPQTAGSDAGRAAALRAHLALGVDRLWNQGAGRQLMTLATTPQDRVVAALGMLHAACPGGFDRAFGDGAGLPAGERAPRLKARDDALAVLAELVAADSTLLLTADVDVLMDDPTAWPHVITAAGWRHRMQHQRDTTTMRTPTLPAPVADSALPIVAPVPDERVTRAGVRGFSYRSCLYALARTPDVLVLTCHDGQGQLLWRQRWPAPPLNSSPSQYVDLHQGVALVAEGGVRVRAFDSWLGSALGAVVPERADLVLTHGAWLTDNRLALLGPLGVRNQLMLLGRRPDDEQIIDLPSAARWLLPLGPVVAVALEDGRVLAYPGATSVTLPEALRTAATAPVVINDGLLNGEWLYRWNRR